MFVPQACTTFHYVIAFFHRNFATRLSRGVVQSWGGSRTSVSRASTER